MKYDLSKISLCACMGPMYGEPLCPCSMQGKVRSKAWIEAHTPEALAKREKELRIALCKAFNIRDKDELINPTD